MRNLSDHPQCNDVTITSLLVNQSIRLGERKAISGFACRNSLSPGIPGLQLTYLDVARINTALVQELASVGVHRASRLAVVLPNGVDLAVGLLAACCTAVAVPLSADFQASEYRTYFCTSKTTHLLTSSDTPPSAMHVASEMNLPIIQLERSNDGYSVKCKNLPPLFHELFVAPLPADIAAILMTSGSTGRPKRVPLSHRNLCTAAHNVASSLHLSEHDRCLVMWEQYHIGGIVDLLLAPLASGSQIFCAGGFDASVFFDAIEKLRPTWFQGVPTTLRELLVEGKLRGRLPDKNTSLRFLRSVAAPLASDVMTQLEDAFGVPVIQTFGMTEAAPLITTNHLPPGKRKPDSTGTPVGCEVAVMDEHGIPLTPNRTGEIAVRGANVFSGYEDDPESNAACFRDGWFYTGDIGHFDDEHFLFLSGRVKELINRGGEKISPSEIEQIAVRHPAIEQAIAFSIPHPTLGEDVALAVVTKTTHPTDQESVRGFIAEYLSGFKVPSVVLFLPELPRCPIGKVRRKELASLVVNAQHETDASPVTDPLEMRLAQLWAVHLDVPQVDPTDDFRLIGGDSLSQIRVMSAVESQFGITFPDHEHPGSLTTVRKMAAEVRSLSRQPVPTLEATSSPTFESERWAIDDAEVDLHFADADPQTIRRRLMDCRTVLEFNAKIETLLNILTLDELTCVIPPKESGPRWVMSRLMRPIKILEQPKNDGVVRLETRITASLFEKLRNTINSQTGPQVQQQWNRSRIAEQVYLYQQGYHSSKGRSLIVGFAGNHMRLMLPTHSILSHLGPRYDLLLLCDVNRHHFSHGIPGLGDDIGELSEWIRSTTATWNYESFVVLGTSAGGLAAIACAYVLKCRRAVVLGADAPSSHPALTTFIQDKIDQANKFHALHPMIVVGHNDLNDRDRKAATEITTRLPRHHRRTLDGGGAHNVLQPALQNGQLQVLLSELLEHSIDNNLAIVDSLMTDEAESVSLRRDKTGFG